MGRDPSLTVLSAQARYRCDRRICMGGTLSRQRVPLDCIVKLRDTSLYRWLSGCVIKSCNLEVVP